MTDLAVLILTRDEERHIARCLDRIAPLRPREIVVVDSGSTDATAACVEAFRAASPGTDVRFVFHAWPGSQAAQFQWALDCVPLRSEWIFRLDADEYVLPELVDEIRARLPNADFDGVILKRRHVVGWLGDRWMRRGMYPTPILRLFRRGKGRSDLKLMDEHILVDGRVVTFDGDFVDHSLVPFDVWWRKHEAYATREALSRLAGESSSGSRSLAKKVYYLAPPYVRPLAYFLYRFLVCGAVWEGPSAWRWCWWHAFRYRARVDAELSRLRRARRKGGDK